MADGMKKDFLDIDDPINGQSYVLLSFVSPDDVIQDKEAFKVAKFLQSYSKENKLEFKKLYDDYTDFIYKYSDEIQKDFDKENDFKTNVRGVKVRGVYNIKEEAEARAKRLQAKDPSFNIFIGQVGYWLPWAPCADKIEKEVFLNEELNELIKQYKENQEHRDIIYEENKQSKIEAIKKENLVNVPDNKTEYLEYNASNLSMDDPLMEPEPEVEYEKVASSASDVSASDVKVSEDIKKAIESDDPWMKQKMDSSCDA